MSNAPKGKPVVIESPVMVSKATGREHSLRAVDSTAPTAALEWPLKVWPPPGWVVVLVPAETGYRMVVKGEALACDATFEEKG